MGKNLIVVAFLFILGFAIYTFYKKDDRDLKKQGTWAPSNKPLIKLEDFLIYRYINHELESTLKGRVGFFVDPNILQIQGNISGVKYKNATVQNLKCEYAKILFEAQGLAQLLNNSKVVHSVFKDNVRVTLKESTLKTQYAEYTAVDGLLKSQLEVQVTTPRSVFDGEKGFLYDVEKENLTIFGPIKGKMWQDDQDKTD